MRGEGEEKEIPKKKIKKNNNREEHAVRRAGRTCPPTLNAPPPPTTHTPQQTVDRWESPAACAVGLYTERGDWAAGPTGTHVGPHVLLSRGSGANSGRAEIRLNYVFCLFLFLLFVCSFRSYIYTPLTSRALTFLKPSRYPRQVPSVPPSHPSRPRPLSQV